MSFALSCHCGAIRLEVDAELTGLVECNCSTARPHGILHWKVPVEAVRLVTQKRALTTSVARRRWRHAILRLTNYAQRPTRRTIA